MELFDAEDVVVVVPRGRRVFVEVPEDDELEDEPEDFSELE